VEEAGGCAAALEDGASGTDSVGPAVEEESMGGGDCRREEVVECVSRDIRKKSRGQVPMNKYWLRLAKRNLGNGRGVEGRE
jgi:hypothetical protein